MTHAIELRNVARSFADGSDQIMAVAPTNLILDSGEFVGIIGPSGSGKSTLLTIMGGLQEPSSGTVFVGGQPFSDLKEKNRARVRLTQLGFILQDSSLVPFLTIKDQFVLYSKVSKNKNNANVDQLLTSLGIEKLAKKYPANLSGGERQRAAIAVALFHQPYVILADEPTASLDTERAMEVTKLLAAQTHERNAATVMVTHDERLLGYCDRILEMVDGVLTEKDLAHTD